MSLMLVVFRRLGRRRGVDLAPACGVLGSFAFPGERITFGDAFESSGDFAGGETDALFGKNESSGCLAPGTTLTTFGMFLAASAARLARS